MEGNLLKRCYHVLIAASFVLVVSTEFRTLRPYPSWTDGIPGLPAPLPATITVNAGDDLQAKYNSALCGDTLILQAGATWDTTSVNTPFVFNKACSAGSPITIRSSGTLPSGRVSPSNAGQMARIRAKGQEGAITFNNTGAYHILDGLEITNVGSDTEQEMVNVLIVATSPNVNNITIQRSYIHPKETGTDYTRSVIQAIYFNGSFLTWRWNYASGFLGRKVTSPGAVDTNRIILCGTCNNLIVHDNFMQAWYAAIFTGGVQEEPQFTATVTSGTTTSGTFSSTTGLTNGIYLRFTLTGTMAITGSSTTCDDHTGGTSSQCRTATQSSGTTLKSGDVDHAIWLTPLGGGEPFRARISIVSGGTITMYPNSTGVTPNGTYTYQLFETANVTGVAGNVVSYTPVGTNALNHNPDSGGVAAWRVDQVVHDITITRNTFDIDFANAQAEHTASGNSPKGWWEFKAGDGVLVEGNTFTGYVSTMGFGQYSNEGTTPWTKIKNVVIRSNWVNSVPSDNFPGGAYLGARAFFTGHLTDPYNTTEPGGNMLITNNLILGEACFIQGAAFANFTVTHNTVINNEQPRHSNSIFPSMNFGTDILNTNWIYNDNIVFQNDAGFNCQVSPGTMTTCWPGISLLKNVIVNNYGQSTGFLTGLYGAGILTPIPTTMAAIGFVDTTTRTVTGYGLSGNSPYKNLASDGTDPGINVATLQAALGTVINPPVVSGRATVSGRAVVGKP